MRLRAKTKNTKQKWITRFMSMRSYSDHFWTRFPKINNKKGATVDLWGGAVDK